MADRAIVKSLDMSEEMAEDIFRIASDAVDKNADNKEAAAIIKRECDRKFAPAWHCIVGKHFGSSVGAESKHYAYFYIGQIGVLLWRTLS